MFDSKEIELPAIEGAISATTHPTGIARAGDKAPDLVRSPDFWASDRGRKTLTWLHAWGLVVRGRLDTGDQAYVPPMESAGVSSGTNRSSPSNVSDVLLRFMDVDRVRPLMSAGQQRVSYFCFVTSQTVRQQFRPIFRDGTRGDWTQGREPKLPKDAKDVKPESPLIVGYENDTRTAFEWDWREFPAEECERRFWRDWGYSPAEHLERELKKLGKLVADELNL